MAEYHVGCGAFGIYAGTISKPGVWKNKTECTEEAICAVLQYMLQEAESAGKRETVYEYAYRQGKPVQIIARFKDGDENG